MNRNVINALMRMGGGRFKWVAVIGIIIYGAYFYFSNQETVPLTGRTQVVDMSRAEEASLGLESYRQILSESQVVPSGQAVDQIREIGRRLAKVSEDPGFKWEFNVIQSEQANAFALPGGKVAVYTGIIPVAKNVDGLAVIMGHEIAHAIARHGAERMAQQKLMNLGQMAAGLSMSDMDISTRRSVMAALGAGAKYGIMLPFSRNHESEADYMGLIYVARACFDPREAPLLWQRMGAASGGQGPSEFMSTHPSSQTRIANFKKWMPEALKIRAEAGCPPLS